MSHACYATTTTVRAWVQQDWVRPDEECRGCARLPQEAALLTEEPTA